MHSSFDSGTFFLQFRATSPLYDIRSPEFILVTDFGSAEQNESRAQVAQGFSSCFAKLLTHLMNF